MSKLLQKQISKITESIVWKTLIEFMFFSPDKLTEPPIEKPESDKLN